VRECNVIAIDLAKDVFQCCIMNRHRKIIFNQALSRKKLIAWLTQQPPSLVAMESCGGSSYWQRLAVSLGHETMLTPPRQVKPFLTGQKKILMMWLLLPSPAEPQISNPQGV
jgi:transposase